MAEKRLSGSACPRRSPVGDIRNVLGSGTHSALIEIAPRRLFNDGERCVCPRRYYFLAAMLPFAWWSVTCPWAVSRAARREMETDMNIFGSRGGMRHRNLDLETVHPRFPRSEPSSRQAWCSDLRSSF